MTDDRNKRPDEERVAGLVRGLADAGADASFRDRLRTAFVAGDLGEVAEPEPARPRRERQTWMRWLAPALAAAALVLMIGVLNQGPSVEVLATAGTGSVTVDGRAIELSDTETLTRALRAGSRLEVSPDATLDLVKKNVSMYEIVGGTQMTLPGSPGRWFNKAVDCSLFVGEMRLKTGVNFPGSTLRVYTPDGMVVVTGSLLSVQVDAGGTCVCVLEGLVEVGVDESDLEAVTPGNRKIMLKDGTKEIIPVKPMHRDGVLDFDNRLGDQMPRQ